jgi:hypothetical protein
MITGQVVKPAPLTAGIIRNKAIGVRNMGTQGNCVCQSVYREDKHIIRAVFLGENFRIMPKLGIKGRRQAMKFHVFPKKTPSIASLGRRALKKPGFLLINVIAPCNHFTDRTFFRLTWLRSTTASYYQDKEFGGKCQGRTERPRQLRQCLYFTAKQGKKQAAAAGGDFNHLLYRGYGFYIPQMTLLASLDF